MLVGFAFHHQIPIAATATNANPMNRAPELVRWGTVAGGLPLRIRFERLLILVGSR
jgi:hypothetical protein